MATLIKKKIKERYYYYYVEIKRINGKPRYTNQIYLGPAEKLVEKIKNAEEIPIPLYSQVFECGSIIALFEIAQRLQLVKLLNECIEKRNQVVNFGEYVLIAAINRAVEPTSKVKIAEWFSKTVLPKIMGIDINAITSQRFWDNMDLFDEAGMAKFEEQFVAKIVNEYNPSTSCLIHDTTNFFTYIDTNSDGQLAKRGHSKKKRNDFKIIGLSLMVSPEQNIPLFYEVYSGNRANAEQLKQIICRLKKRYETITGKTADITLVFDRGNNSEKNIELLSQDEISFSYVGGLRLNQCKELLDVPKEAYKQLAGMEFGEATAFRTKATVYNKEMTVLLINNPELMQGQWKEIRINIEKCVHRLDTLKEQLSKRSSGKITKGKKPTEKSVKKQISTILSSLSSECMKEVFEITLVCNDGIPEITYNLNEDNLEIIREKWLGKTALFTDKHHWTNEQIAGAYKSAWHVEHAFRQMKSTEHLSVRPNWYWQDHKVKVHIFFCFLAYRLCCILKRELEEKGIKISINEMLSKLSELKQVINFYEKKKGKERTTYSMTQVSDLTQNIIKGLNLDFNKLVR
jgi:transposase